ncbi:uncharacterized protein LOC106643069 [Copidosoma floridanum]|uniref:uncharacterized protein LOC106643069 n=1 Tax=Copidosoma floridanum TaxID=29053 RepID=UPI0006C9E1E6|nr:uncharacterized protein LOC106643069 [Copidosoma floridanum]
MAAFKCSIFVLVISCWAFISTNAFSQSWGDRVKQDTLACYGDVHLASQPGQILKKVITCNIQEPYQHISYIEARDVGPLGKQSFPKLEIGGIGYDTLTMVLTSERGQPLDFDFHVYSLGNLGDICKRGK